MLYLYELIILFASILIAYVSFMLYGRVKRYYRREKRLTEIEDQYERLRNSRRDFLVFLINLVVLCVFFMFVY